MRVGAMDGDPAQVLGVVQDVASDAHGNFAALDAQSQTVRIFSPSGRFLARVGRPGRGPGEFFVPVAVAYDGSGHLYVLDQANQRVEVFAPASAGSGHVRSFPIDFPASDLCALGDRLYLLGFRNGTLIHTYTFDGHPAESFGAAERPRDPYFSVSLARGLIECMEEARTVIFLPLLSANVRGWRVDGRLQWTSSIPGYEPVVIRRSGRRVTYSRGPNNRHHMASSIAKLDGASALIQVGFVRDGARSAEEFTEVGSYRVFAADGRVRRVTSNTPRILQIGAGYAFGVRPDPFPTVTVFRISQSTQGQR
ncbi:MAG TPA: 6-bladed beta-propeller [Longimicrobium sp.]